MLRLNVSLTTLPLLTAKRIEVPSKIKIFPFPDFEYSAIDEKEVGAPLDEQQ